MLNIINGSSAIGLLHLTAVKLSIPAARSVYHLAPSSVYVEKLIHNQKHSLECSINARKFPGNLETVVADWNNMTAARRTLEDLESRKVSLSHLIREQLNKKESATGKDVSQLKEEAKQVRNEIKDISKNLKLIEEKAISGVLALPNILHPRTPINNNEEYPLESAQERNQIENLDHFIYKSHHSPASVYLQNGAADEEAKWIETWVRDWSAKGFLKLTSPDFVKRNVVFGCGYPSAKLFSLRDDHEADESDDRMVLVGGGSLYAILAYLMRNVVEEPYPLRLFSVGRRYLPESHYSDEAASNQDTAIQLLTVTENCPDVMFNELLSMQTVVTEQLNSLKLPIQLKTLNAHELHPWEQYSSVIKVPLSQIDRQVTIARFSIAGDYISRRLSIYAGPAKTPPGLVTAQIIPIVKHLMLL